MTDQDKRERVLPANATAIKAVKPQQSQVNWRIKGAKGLVLAVHPTGTKTWMARYQIGSGPTRKQRWKELGDATIVSLAQACNAAEDIRRGVRDGVDPAKPAIETLDDLYNLWLKKHAKANLRTWEMEARRYERQLKKALGAKPFAEIQRKDLREVRDDVYEESGPIESNRVVALFNRIANWAVNEDHAKFNPAANLKKTGAEKRRERVLDNDELQRIWAVLDQEVAASTGTRAGGVNEADTADATAMRRALKLLILTGQRRSEVVEMAKSELHLEGQEPLWTLPKERSKNKLPHNVPLTPMAVELLREAITASGDSPYVFPSSRTDGPLRGDAATKALQRLCKRMTPVIEGVGPHDMPRTVGTNMRKIGVSVEDRGHVFNHVGGAKSKVTSWNYDAGEHDVEKRAALKRWERELRRIVGLDAGVVVRLRA